jgi:hypothetical protein
MSVDCIVADDNPLLDFISIKNLNLNLNLSGHIGSNTRVSQILLSCTFYGV